MNLIELHSVQKYYCLGGEDIHALRDIHLNIPKGEFVVIQGPSGSGKTTLLNLIGGLEPADEGRVTVDGQDITALGEAALTLYRRQKVGLVFQFFNLIPTLTALENVIFAAELVGDQAGNAAEILELVGLAPQMNYYPGQLSGGQQQRVAIARALVKNPALLLADEPTGSLDSRTGREVLAVMQDANRERGQTVLIVTHNPAISKIADRVIHISDGNVLAVEQNENAPASADLGAWY